MRLGELEDYGTVALCVDCTMWHANGEVPPEWSEEECREWRDRIDANLADCGLTLGIWVTEHAEDCPNLAAGEYVDDCECERVTFSSEQCGSCGTTMGGERTLWTLWGPPDA